MVRVIRKKKDKYFSVEAFKKHLKANGYTDETILHYVNTWGRKFDGIPMKKFKRFGIVY